MKRFTLAAGILIAAMGQAKAAYILHIGDDKQEFCHHLQAGSQLVKMAKNKLLADEVYLTQVKGVERKRICDAHKKAKAKKTSK